MAVAWTLQKAGESKDYAQEIQGIVRDCGLEVTELSSHLQGQLVAVNPAYNEMFDGFAPKEVHGNAKARTEWAVNQLKSAAKASRTYGFECTRNIFRGFDVAYGVPLATKTGWVG